MSLKILFIGSQHRDWRDHSSKLLNSDNFQEILASKIHCDYHTSWHDIGQQMIPWIFAQAEIIDFQYFAEDHGLDSYQKGRLQNEIFNHRHKIQNLPDFMRCNLQIDPLEKINRGDDSTVWIVGCALSTEFDQSWSQLLSSKIPLDVCNLSKSRTSLQWAADRLLRHDIRPGDMVIWGMTSIYHKTEVSTTDWIQRPIKHSTIDEISPEQRTWVSQYLSSHDLAVKNLRSVYQTMSVMEKLKVKLLMVNLLDVTWLETFLHKYDNFIDLTNTLDPLGTDAKFHDLHPNGQHPGPVTHQYYADRIYQHLKKLKWL